MFDIHGWVDFGRSPYFLVNSIVMNYHNILYYPSLGDIFCMTKQYNTVKHQNNLCMGEFHITVKHQNNLCMGEFHIIFLIYFSIINFQYFSQLLQRKHGFQKPPWCLWRE